MIAVPQFEQLQDDPPGTSRQVFRPLVRVLQTEVLPGALHAWHPEMERLFWDAPAPGARITHFVCRASLECLVKGYFPLDVLKSATYMQYEKELADSVRFERLTIDRYEVILAEFIQPPYTGEAWLLALCAPSPRLRKDAATLVPARFFSLEVTNRTYEYRFCECTRDGQHHELGQLQGEGHVRFAESVTQQLAHCPEDSS